MLERKVIGKIKTHFRSFDFFFFFENFAFGEIMWQNTVEADRSQMTIRSMRIACWIPKATHTHSDYVILIAFPLQQKLDERASLLHYTYIGCLGFICTFFFAQELHLSPNALILLDFLHIKV